MDGCGGGNSMLAAAETSHSSLMIAVYHHNAKMRDSLLTFVVRSLMAKLHSKR